MLKASMRYFTVTLVLAALPFLLAANVYDESAKGRDLIKTAVARAAKEHKLVLVVWGANWCGWCQRLNEIMSKDTATLDILQENYVVTKIDLGDRNKHMDLAREYGLEFKQLGIPHMLVLDETGKKFDHTALKPLAEKGDYSPRLIAQYLKKVAERQTGQTKTKGEAGGSKI